MIKRLLSYCLIFLHTFVQAQVPFSHPDASQDFCIGCKSFETFIPKQLTLLSEGEIGVGALASEHHSHQGDGGNWRKDVRIQHRLTQVEVGHLRIATPGNLKVTGLEVTGASAKIQLRGAYLANSPQDFSHHSSHSESDGWFSSSSEDVSYTAQTTRRNVLNIKDATLSASRFVDRGGDYSGRAHATSPRAQIEAVIDKLERVESSTDSNLFFKSGESRGDIRHTPVFTKFKNLTLSTAHAHLDAPPGQGKPQGLTLVPFNPASLQPPHVGALLQAFLEEGRALPAPSHALPAEAEIHPSPKEIPEQELPLAPQLHINPVGETHEQWDRSTFSLTPGFAAVLALAVTIATGTPLGDLASGITGATQGFAFGAVEASLQAATTATVVGTLNHQGNVFKALEDLGKPSGLKSIALAGLTGGLVDGASLKLGIPKQPKTLGEHFQKAAIKAAVSVPVEATLGGQTFEKALISGATTFAADTLGGVSSQHLGEARLEGLGFLEHKLAHGLVGAATGAILNPDDPGRGAAAGALGSVVGETVAELSLGIPQLLENKEHLRPEDLPNKEHTETAHNLARLSAATAALLTRQDVTIAAHTAHTAVEHNNKLVVEGLKAAAKKGAFLWKKGKDWFAKRAAEKAKQEAQKETAQKSAKEIAKELQKPQKTIGKGRHQVMKPESRADGDHTVFKMDANGKIKNYETYTKNPKNPSGFDSKKRVDLQGAPHTNKKTEVKIPAPHVKGKDIPGGVRPARPDEIPK
ncbi:MAG: DUF637 domain-containing protein [Alphaproteobacteria bacterium]